MIGRRRFSLAYMFPNRPTQDKEMLFTQLNLEMVNHAVDIHGGKGICMEPNNYIAQRHIEDPLAITSLKA